MIASFLDHLERGRHNTARTRNWRLAAIHSLFAYAALAHPEHAAVIQRVLAVPDKRHERRLVTWLTEPEVDALLAAPDRSTWTSRQTTPCSCSPCRPVCGSPSSSACHVAMSPSAPGHTSVARGKAARNVPPRSPGSPSPCCVGGSARPGQAHDPLFPTRSGARLSHDAIEHRLAGYLIAARRNCPSLLGKHVTMHTMRHTCAMRLLQAGTDIAVIALWLGHEQIATANINLHADMSQKERAIARVTPPGTAPGRYQPSDPLLSFLDGL